MMSCLLKCHLVICYDIQTFCKIVGPQTSFSSAVSRCRQAASDRLLQFRFMTCLSRVGEGRQLRGSSSAPGHDLLVLLCASSTSEVEQHIGAPPCTINICSLCRMIDSSKLARLQYNFFFDSTELCSRRVRRPCGVLISDPPCAGGLPLSDIRLL